MNRLRNKKGIKAVIFLLSVLLILSGCSAKTAVNVPEQPTPEPTPDPVALEIQSFFENYVDTEERPIAIMVDNDDKNARPHAGLNEAYLIYEMAVEGGSTRFMALFRHNDTEKIGPVRSSRHYFLDYLMEHDAIYTHYGWSPKAQQDIASFGIQKINGVLGVDGNIFWREQKFKGDWHSAYTSIEKIKAMAEQKGYPIETNKKSGFDYADSYVTLESGKPANRISLPYSGHYTTGYQYNPESGLYEKSIGSAPHVMQNGEVLAVKNVLIQLIADSSLGDGSDRRELITTGSGKGYYITGGFCEEITWSKSSRKANTVYKRADGTTLLISPGKTIVNIISPQAGAVIE